MEYTVVTGSARLTSVPSFHTITGNQSIVGGVDLPALKTEAIAQKLADMLVSGALPDGPDLQRRLREVCAASPPLPHQAGGQSAGQLRGVPVPDLAPARLGLGPRGRRKRTPEPDQGTPPQASEDCVEPDEVKFTPLLTLPNRTELDRPKLDRPKRRLRDLSADRRFALASRGSLGMQRALWPDPTPRIAQHRAPVDLAPSACPCSADAAAAGARPASVGSPPLRSGPGRGRGAYRAPRHRGRSGAPRETAMILLSIVVLAAVMGLVSAVRSILRWRRIDDAVPSEVPAADIVSTSCEEGAPQSGKGRRG